MGVAARCSNAWRVSGMFHYSCLLLFTNLTGAYVCCDGHEFVVTRKYRLQWSNFVQFESVFDSVDNLATIADEDASARRGPVGFEDEHVPGCNSVAVSSEMRLPPSSVLEAMPTTLSATRLQQALGRCQEAWSLTNKHKFLDLLWILLSIVEHRDTENIGAVPVVSPALLARQLPFSPSHAAPHRSSLGGDSMRPVAAVATLSAVASTDVSDPPLSASTYFPASMIHFPGSKPPSFDDVQARESAGSIAFIEDEDDCVLLDTKRISELDNEDISRRLFLNESDFMSLFKAFPIRSYVDAQFIDIYARATDATQLSYGLANAFAACKNLAAAISNAIHHVPEYPQFAKLLAQCLTYLSWAPIMAWQTITPIMRLPPVELNQIHTLFQRELDWLCLRSTVAVNCARQPGIRFFLSDFPFARLSPAAAGQIFLAIFWNREVSYFDDSSSRLHPLTLDDWLVMMQNDPQVRLLFATWLQKQTRDSVHVLHAMDKLARQAGNDLLLIWVTELFFVAFVHAETREALFQTCQPMFASTCDQDQRCVSILLALTLKYFKFLERAASALFKQLDLTRWSPSTADLKRVQQLLLHDATTPRNELGRCLIASLNFGYDQARVSTGLVAPAGISAVASAVMATTTWDDADESPGSAQV
jgi:hypothetical protein